MLDKVHPSITKGAYLDDRNFRGKVQELVQLDATISQFDLAAGLTTQHEKTEYAVTEAEDKKYLKSLKLNGGRFFQGYRSGRPITDRRAAQRPDAGHLFRSEQLVEAVRMV